MTRAVRDRILKEANGDISDHLRNHIHLTNCIHLKNHMHKHSPILADRSLMRDLIVLQRSRSLRDPSASPPSWQSPSLTDLPPRVGENNAVIREGRRSVGTESRRVGRTMSGSSPLSGSFATSKVIPADMNYKMIDSFLVGLISDEKLVDLLDLALSADTVNTVKNLRLIIESGVEPMALISQIATVITDILAGSYDFKKERPRRKFFRRQPLSKEDMEKLRQALRTLSEAEKQLRMSNDKLTWLTAALLQLAPDQQYMLSSSAETSFNHSPLALNNVNGRGLSRNAHQLAEIPQKGLSTDLYDNRMAEGISLDKKRHSGVGVAPQQTIASADDLIKSSGKQVSGKDIEEIWLEVLGKIRRNSIKEFFIQEGKLASVSFGAAPTVRLIFNSHHAKSKAEKLREQILQAFESALGSSVIIEFRCELKNHSSVTLPASKNGLLHIRDMSSCEPQAQLSHYGSGEVGRGEIVEIDALPRVAHNQRESNHRNLEGSQGEVSVSRRNSTMPSISETREGGAQSQSQRIVRSKVSLAHVIQQAEGCSQRNGRSKHKAVSIAEELEQENLRLEPQSRSLLCWKASRVTQRKLSRLKIRNRRPQSLLKFVSCGKCLSA